ncbi:MAG: hypothetical protein V1698_01765 [bacterium]
MSEINLALKSKSKSGKKWVDMTCLAVSAVLILASSGFCLFHFNKSNKKTVELNQLKESEKNVQGEISALDPDGIRNFGKRVKNIGILLKNHTYFLQVLENLENSTISTVWYEELDANIEENKVSLKAKTADFIEVAKQYKNFLNDKGSFSKVEIGDKTSEDDQADEAEYSFSIDLAYKDEFIRKNKIQE